MTAEQIRKLFDYHIKTNQELWNTSIIKLTDEQFTQPIDYSVGSIRNHCVHLMSVDDSWFSELRGLDVPAPLNPLDFPTREKIRMYWDRVEADMKTYLDKVTDEQLNEAIPDGPVWAVLQHVAFHGVDHRAQMLVMLHKVGAPTFPQDFIFYLEEN